MKTQKVTIHTLRQMKERGEKIAMLTAYDATFARLLDEAGADVLLVGDSLGMVVQGHETTLPVTLDEIRDVTRLALGTDFGIEEARWMSRFHSDERQAPH